MISVEDYINHVISYVKSKNLKTEIASELKSHIFDRAEYFMDMGLDEETAISKAVEKMGDAEKVAVQLKKLHSNKHLIILSIVFILLYAAGLIYADVNMVDFAVINMVDFTEISEMTSIASVLIFLCGVLAFNFAYKANNKFMLLTVGIAHALSMLLSPYAMMPFGYQVISVFTDFPAAIIKKECFFCNNEIFWKIDNLFPNEAPDFIYQFLIILCILVSLFTVVIGIASIVSAIECDRSDSDSKLSKINKFRKFVIILACFAIAVTIAECTYDGIIISIDNKKYEENEPFYVAQAFKEFDKYAGTKTKQEILKLANTLDYEDYQSVDIEYGMFTVFENDTYFLQLRDDDEDDIFETKRLYRSVDADIDLSNNTLKYIESLEKGSDISELECVFQMSDYEEIFYVYEDDGVKKEFTIKGGDDDYHTFVYKNDKLITSTFYDDYYTEDDE